MRFPFFTIFFLFLCWFTFRRLRAEKKDRTLRDAFWEKEEQANATRRQDLSLLPYITIPLEQLPLQTIGEDSVSADCADRVQALSQEKIVNLSGHSNTELKLQYGAPNLPLLSRYDQNFTELIRLLQTWGSRLYELSFLEEAEQVLSFAISCGSDIKGTYLLLAKIYRETGRTSYILRLRESAESLTSLMKESILTALEEETNLP